MAKSISIKVVYPTTRNDGTAIGSGHIGGAHIFQRQGDGSFAQIASLTYPADTFTLANAAPGDYVFKASCFDTDTSVPEGDASDAASVNVPAPLAPLAQPTINVTVTG